LIVAALVLAAGSACAQGPGEKEGEHKVAQPAHTAAAGWTVLFDGKSTEHFRGYRKDKLPDGWELVDGTLHCKAKSGAGDIITKEQYENFELEFEWKISKGGNSGVMYRVRETDGPSYMTGPEYQILDNEAHADKANPKTTAAALYDLYPCTTNATKPAGEWNVSKIVINNNKIEHWLNGKKVVETEIGSEDWKKKISESKFKDWSEFGVHSKGHIAFQDHGDDVWYRNIKIKSLHGEKKKEEVKPKPVGA
jgi:hypothetical protein